MSFRGFIAIDIEADDPLGSFSRAMGQTGADIKLVNMDNIHLTLKFLGDTDEGRVDKIGEIIKEAVDGVSPFVVKFKGAGAFPNLNHMKVIWVGIEGAGPIVEIAKDIDEGVSKLGYKKEKRDFSPHITLARVRGGRKKSELARVIQAHSDIIFGEQRIISIKLKKSVLTPSGPIYSDLVTVPLK